MRLQHKVARHCFISYFSFIFVAVPYADPEKQRAYLAARYRKLYEDEEFRKKEAERKALWFQGQGVAERRAKKLAAWRKKQKRKDSK